MKKSWVFSTLKEELEAKLYCQKQNFNMFKIKEAKMKKILKGFVLFLMVISFSGIAGAASYDFEDMIDTWGVCNLDAVYISQSNPLEFTHDLTDDVNFSAGDLVTEASLELDFTNDWSDDRGSIFWGIIKWDFREIVKVAYDGSGWINIGEQDNGQYDLVLDIDWLNDDGLLDVTIKVGNSLGTADAWLDHSRLYGTAESAPVPEPATMLLLGTGLLGIAATSRKKILKKK